MDVRTLLAVARDLVTTSIGVAGVIHEEWYTTSERPFLLALYAGCLVGVATVNGQKLIKTLARTAAAEDASTTHPPISSPSSPPAADSPTSHSSSS